RPPPSPALFPYTTLFRSEVRGEKVLHLLVGDLNTLGDTALAHTADDHLPANLLAGGFQAQPVRREGAAELVEGHVVALGDGGQSLVELFVRVADTRAIADL